MYFILILLVILIVKNFYAILKINNILAYFSTSYNELSKLKPIENIPIYILIPVLNGANNIESTINYYKSFLCNNIYLFFITTEKETLKTGINNTYNKINSLLLDHNNSYIGHIHYPYKNGVKSDQINFSINKLWKNDSKFRNSFVAIYDIDSRPHKKTFYIFRNEYQKNKKYNVFQQSAIFLNNRKDLGNTYTEKIFLRMVSIAQTRFTFVHEIPRIMRKTSHTNSFFDRITYTHCVGHGLFIKASFLKKIPLPKNYYPEDMFYGYLLSCMRENIYPIFVLDNSDMHTNFKDLFIQRSNWFLGPFLSIKYNNYLKSRYTKLYNKNKISTFFITIYSFFNSLEWLFTSLVFVFLIIGLFYNNETIKILSIIVLISYIYSYLILIKKLNTLEYIGGKKIYRFKNIDYIIMIIISPLYLLFHSIPAWYKIGKIIR